jgi:hypothetical protein
MVDAMRAMLDELMGKERDVPLEERTNRGYTFSDKEVCKYALAGLCPYGLFKNTKSDLGMLEIAYLSLDLRLGCDISDTLSFLGRDGFFWLVLPVSCVCPLGAI